MPNDDDDDDYDNNNDDDDDDQYPVIVDWSNLFGCMTKLFEVKGLFDMLLFCLLRGPVLVFARRGC